MRRVWMLVTMVILTASAGWSAGTVSTYCQGTCANSGQPVMYSCGYSVSAVKCCSRARTNACPGDEFDGTCTETYGTIGC